MIKLLIIMVKQWLIDVKLREYQVWLARYWRSSLLTPYQGADETEYFCKIWMVDFTAMV